MMAGPSVSVIIPCHNAAGTLAATLQSLAAQDFPDWEAIIIDDASTDSSAAIATAFAARDARFQLLAAASTAPVGAANARNRGMNQAKGRFIAFLDADDLWRPQKLSRQVAVLRAGAGIVFSSYRRFDGASGRTLGIVSARPRITYADALHGNPIGCLTAIWDKQRFGPARMPDLVLQHDYAFWLSLLRTGATATGLAEVLADYRVTPGSLSGRKLRAACATWQVLRDEPGLPLAKAAAGFAHYAATSVLRRLLPAAVTRTLSDR